MAVYNYVALDANNKTVKGQVTAESEYRAVLSATENGLRVTEVREDGHAPIPIGLPQRMDWQDLALFAEHLQAAVQTGVTLPASIEMLSRSLTKARLRRLLDDIRPRLERGDTLSDALGTQRGVFPPVFLTLVRAGEQTGKLSDMLDQLSRYSRQMADTRMALREVVAYPAFLTVFGIGMLVFLGTSVVPAFKEVYSAFDENQLPLATKILLAFSDRLMAYGFELGISAVVLIAMFFVLIRLTRATMGFGNSFDLWWDRMKLRMPLLGKLYLQALTARFSETLSAFLETRVDVPEGLVLAGVSSGSPVLSDASMRAAMLVTHGETMARALAQVQFFEPAFLWLLERGEQQGTPVEALKRLSQSTQRDLERRRQMVIALSGPAFISVIALLVLFMALAIFMPIVSLSSVVGQM
jgi:type II secretory pathway component PulF